MLKKLLLVLLALTVVAGLLLSRDWDSPELGKALLDEAGAAAGIEIHSEGFRLNLLRGVVLENVEARSTGEDRELTFSLERLVFEHRLLPLLTGTVAVDRVVLEEPQFVLVPKRRAAGKAPPPRETETGSSQGAGDGEERGLALEIHRIQVSDGSLSIHNEKGEEKTRIEGLDLEMENVRFDPSASSLAALSAEGTLSIAKMLFEAIEVRETRGRFELNDAVFVVPELSFSTEHGRFSADARVDFGTVPYRYELSANGEPLDVNSMVGASEGFGPGTVQLEASGSGPETRDLVARGEMRLAEGRFPGTAMFERLDSAVGKRVLAGSSYEATEARFRLERNRIVLAPFRFQTGEARLELEGWMGLDGSVDFDLSLATPREGLAIEGVGSNALDLVADDGGWVPVPIGITGTLKDPTVRPDVRRLASQARRGAEREVTEKATDALRGLLKKKQND